MPIVGAYNTERGKLVSEPSDSLAQFGTDPKLAAGKRSMLTTGGEVNVCYGEATQASKAQKKEIYFHLFTVHISLKLTPFCFQFI